MWPELAEIPQRWVNRLQADATYSVYLDRQAEDIAAARRDEALMIPDWVDYAGMPGLSSELKAKLELIWPQTLGQAGRIEGVTPAAISLLAAHARRARQDA